MSKEYRTKFSARLKELRENYNFTPAEFADYLGVKVTTYYSYESERSVPSFESLIDIAKKCGVSLDWLCNLPPAQNCISHQSDIASVLAQLLQVKTGKDIEVRIKCHNSRAS